MTIAIALISSIPSALAVALAGLLAYRKVKGWGWFLIVGLLLIGSIKVTAS